MPAGQRHARSNDAFPTAPVTRPYPSQQKSDFRLAPDREVTGRSPLLYTKIPPLSSQNRLLLCTIEVANALSISPCHCRRIMPRLVAAGLRPVTIPSPRGNRPLTRYHADSLRRLVDRAAETDSPLTPNPATRRHPS